MLRQALESIAAQDCADVETIVVDGGSTDGSLEDLARLSDIRVLTGPDQGVFDAFNKGLAAARGDIVGILNSDDLYAPGAFAAVRNAFAQHPTADAICGTAELTRDSRTIQIFDDPRDKRLTPRTIMIGSCIPNARFFRRSAMARIGSFSTDYRYVADRDWLARWYEAGLKTIPLPNLVYTYRMHAGSLTFDESRSHESSIRHELLRLARHWTHATSASADMRRAARLLEGRCLGWLAISALRNGQLGSLARYLFKDADRWSFAPAVAIIGSAIDRQVQRTNAGPPGRWTCTGN
jgi:glycosyltransferase involved in cell wall biosynthesis